MADMQLPAEVEEFVRTRPDIARHVQRVPLVVSAAGYEHIMANPQDYIALLLAKYDFREFLKYWWVAAEGMQPFLLGGEPFEAQEIFSKEAMLEAWIYFLKARQLGESTIECAFDGWRARFGAMNSRVHIVSRTETESIGLLVDVKFGLDNMPEWMQLPYSRDTTKEIAFEAGEKDKRIIHAYPSTNPGRGETCTHLHFDEWAELASDCMKAYSAAEPSVVRPAPRGRHVHEGGTFHIVTTGQGPQNYASIYFRKTIEGDTDHHACFVDALKRPDRDEKWYARKKKSTPNLGEFLREYPMTWQEAISGGGELFFTSQQIDHANEDARGFSLPIPGRKYAVGADIGRHADAAVIVVLDVTDEVHDVVFYKRLLGQEYPFIQRNLEDVWVRYCKGRTYGFKVESNSAGEAVIENLDLPEDVQKEAKFTTSKASKARILAQAQLMLQNWCLKWKAEECPELDAEMRGYVIPDDAVIQDSVIALCIAEEAGDAAQGAGRVGEISTW